MIYPKIKRKILTICNECTSVVSIKDHDYTYQPDQTYIINTINNTIDELIELRDAIILERFS